MFQNAGSISNLFEDEIRECIAEKKRNENKGGEKENKPKKKTNKNNKRENRKNPVRIDAFIL